MRAGHCQNILGLTVVLLASRLGQGLDTGSSLSPGSQRTGAEERGCFFPIFRGLKDIYFREIHPLKIQEMGWFLPIFRGLKDIYFREMDPLKI